MQICSEALLLLAKNLQLYYRICLRFGVSYYAVALGCMIVQHGDMGNTRKPGSSLLCCATLIGVKSSSNHQTTIIMHCLVATGITHRLTHAHRRGNVTQKPCID